jgi:hypothetical protein
MSSPGRAVVKNNCPFDVFVFPIDGVGSDIELSTRDSIYPAATLQMGDEYLEIFHYSKDAGVSIKLSRLNSSSPPITQFEYTFAEPEGKVYYDGSDVDCTYDCPFKNYGASIVPSYMNCPVKACDKNETCSFYQNPYDDAIGTAACNASTDLIMYLC